VLCYAKYIKIHKITIMHDYNVSCNIFSDANPPNDELTNSNSDL